MLVVNEADIDLGNLSFGKPHNFQYKVKNNSDQNIKVTKLIKGCGSCTKASINKTDIAPNESALISVEVTPGSTGINKKTIQVLYDDKENLTLSFKAFVQK